MTARDADSTEIKPLTKRTGQGKLYVRRPDAEMQIKKIVTLDTPQILAMLENKHRDEPDYLLDETIVYLLREARLRDDVSLLETLYPALNRRIWKLIAKFYGNFDSKEDFEDFGQTVETAIVEKIFDTRAERADYAQVNFGDFVVTEARGRRRGILAGSNRTDGTFPPDRDEREGTSKSDEDRFVSEEISPEEKLILRETIAMLPQKYRQVAILHYLEGWPIESGTKGEPAIDALYNVSPRTIRNWLAQAREMLAARQGEAR